MTFFFSTCILIKIRITKILFLTKLAENVIFNLQKNYNVYIVEDPVKLSLVKHSGYIMCQENFDSSPSDKAWKEDEKILKVIIAVISVCIIVGMMCA